MGKEKVAIIGSGNWWAISIQSVGGQLTCRGSAIAKIAGENVKKHSDVFEERAPIWVFEEDVSGLFSNTFLFHANVFGNCAKEGKRLTRPV